MIDAAAIESAEQQCRAAWIACPTATVAWCCHHSQRFEALTESFEERIQWIRTYKSMYEQEVRFNNFRPFRIKRHIKTLPVEVLRVIHSSIFTANIMRSAHRALEKADDLVAVDEVQYIWNNAHQSIIALNNLIGMLNIQFSSVMDVIHLRDVPQHTWNGRTIGVGFEG